MKKFLLVEIKHNCVCECAKRCIRKKLWIVLRMFLFLNGVFHFSSSAESVAEGKISPTAPT